MLRLFGNLVLNLFRLPLLPVWWLSRLVSRPRATWVHVRLRGQLVEIERPVSPLFRFIPALSRSRPTSLSVLRELADEIAKDPRIEGVLLEVPPLSSGWAVIGGLRAVLVQLRKVGKRVVVFLPQGGGNREIYLASAASRVLTTPNATLAPLGVAASSTYVKGLLDRLGVEVEVHRRAEYKSAAEGAMRETMSDAQREQLGALLDTWDRALVEALCERPGWDEPRVRALFDDGILSGRASLEAGLVDGVVYEDELRASLAAEGQEPPKLVRASAYLSFRLARFFRPVRRRSYIAVLPVHGAITGGREARSGRAVEGAIINAIRTLARDRRAAGVVLHVDSPGGSALASDLIHREVVLLAKKKPVVACFGNVAASGGYYVAAPASKIVAEPLSITGSIGVVMARLVTRDLLEGMGVRTEVVRRAPHADLVSNPRPLDEDEHAILEREVEAFYRSFVGVVAAGRKREEGEIEPLARGRVWSGRDAHARGLVDVLGGLDAAVAEVRRALPGPLPPRVEPRVVWPRGGEAAPLEADAKSAARWALASIDPAAAELVGILGGRERVLYLATGIPAIE